MRFHHLQITRLQIEYKGLIKISQEKSELQNILLIQSVSVGVTLKHSTTFIAKYIKFV